MRILIIDTPHPILVEELQKAGHTVVVDASHTYESLLRCVNQYDCLVVRSKISIDRNFLDHARHLRCIAREGAGMDTIDVEYAEHLGICCLNSPEGNRDAVGEHALALLLALFDKIACADAQVRLGCWDREGNRGLEVKGKTVGIIGFGNMGRAFAQRLQGFECRILVYDKAGKSLDYPDYVQPVALQQLQAEADVLSLHIPLDGGNRYFVDEAFLSAFAKSFYLINTSRGAVVKTEALVQAMKEGRVRGAALDVLEYENLVQDGCLPQATPEPLQYLQQSAHVVLTPHVAGWTVESKYKLSYFLAQKINQTLLQ